MKKRMLLVLCAALCLAAMAGCAGSADVTITPKPAPTLSPYDGIVVTGTVSLKLENEMFVVTCTNDLPSGALLTVILLDINGNEIAKVENVLQNNGVCSASFSAANARTKAQENAATALIARVEFFPGLGGQPQDVATLFGEKGSELAGENVVLIEETGQEGLCLESEALHI